MFTPTKPLRTLNVCDHGSTYTIHDDTDASTPLYTIHWTPNRTPLMTVYHGDDVSKIAGTATWHPSTEHRLLHPASQQITLLLPSGTAVSMDKESGLFSTDKRTLRSAILGEVHWKGGYSNTVFIKLEDGDGKIMADYKALRVGERMGVMDVYAELGQEGLDEVVVSGVAMLSDEMTSMGATAAALATGVL